MKTEHTPGPWAISPMQYYWDAVDEIRIVPIDGYGNIRCDGPICDVFDGDGHPAKANARLIAAAPDIKKERDELKEINREMLEALTMIWKGHVPGGTGRHRYYKIYPDDMPYLQDLIKKATGKTWAEIKEVGE